MPSSHRSIRARFPRRLLEKMARRAKAEKTDLNRLILNAVKADLQRPGPAAAGKRPNCKKTSLP